MKYFIIALLMPIITFADDITYFYDAKSYAGYRLSYLDYQKARHHNIYEELESDPEYQYDTNYLHGYVNGSHDAYRDMLNFLDSL